MHPCMSTIQVHACPASGQSGTGLKKTNDAGTGLVPDYAGTGLVPDYADTVWHFLVQFRTKIRDAGMPMPALVSSMPMPTYAYLYMYILYLTDQLFIQFTYFLNVIFLKGQCHLKSVLDRHT
jgi:hypothetical protein